MYHNTDPATKFSALALRLALVCGIACTALIGQANAEQTIYKWVDAKGATHYSYRAPQNAKKTSKVKTYNDYSSTPYVPSTPDASNNPETAVAAPTAPQPPLANQPAKPPQQPTQPTVPQQPASNTPTAEKTQSDSSGLSRI